MHVYDLITFPFNGKTEVIILPKPVENDYTDPSAFRPVCFLPILGKMLERIILNRIIKLSDLSNGIRNSQHGFRKGKSTITALEDLTKQINIGFQNKSYTSCVQLDIKGAFDNAWHLSFIATLKKENCPDYLIKWIFSFLNQRITPMRLFDQEFETCIKKDVHKEVLCQLFLNYKTLRLNLANGFLIQGFADDLVISKRGMNKNAIQNSLHETSDRLVK